MGDPRDLQAVQPDALLRIHHARRGDPDCQRAPITKAGGSQESSELGGDLLENVVEMRGRVRRQREHPIQLLHDLVLGIKCNEPEPRGVHRDTHGVSRFRTQAVGD